MDAETKQPSRLRFRGGPPEVPLDIYLDRSCIGGCVFPLEVHKPVRRLPQADKKELHLQTTSLTVDEEGSVTQIRRFEELAKINFLLSEDPSSPTLPIPNDEADLVLKASYGHALYCGVLTSFTTGRGTCESNASAYTTNIAYDAAANPTLITSPGTSLNGVVQTGHVETRQYNTYGQLVQRLLPQGGEVVYSYHPTAPGKDRVSKVKARFQPGSGDDSFLIAQFQYNAPGDITKVTDPKGNVTDYTINSERLVTQIAYPLVSGESSRITAKYAYNKNKLLVEATVDNKINGVAQSNAEWTRRIKYNAENLAESTEVEVSDSGTPVFQKQSFFYDYERRLTKSVSHPSSNPVHDMTVDFEYNLYGKLTKTIAAKGTAIESSAVSEFDDAGNLTLQTRSFTNPGGGVVQKASRFEYDTFRRLKKAFDANTAQDSNWTELEYDCESHLVSVKSFDKLGVPLLETQFEYDELGRRHKVKRGVPVSGSPTTIVDTTTIHHDTAGRVTKVIDQHGNYVDYVYDEAGRLLETTSMPTAGQSEANSVSYSYDLNSNLTQTIVTEVDPLDLVNPTRTHISVASFDALNRLKSSTYLGYDDVTGPNPTSQVLAYDSRGLVITKQDVNGIKTAYAYDGLGRVKQATLNATGSSPAPINLYFSYDLAGRLTSKTDGKGNATTFAYDVQGRVIGTYQPGGVTESTTYNELGLPKTTSDSKGATTSLYYDIYSQLTQRTVSFGSGTLQTTSETFQYDGLHRLTQAQDDDTLVKYAYNTLGQLTSEKLKIQAGTERTTSYQWDPTGKKLEQVTYPASAATVGYTYDELYRPKTLSRNGTTHVKYDYEGAGLKLTRKERSLYFGFSPDLTTAYAYDPLDRNTQVNHTRSSGTPATIRSLTYTWGNGTTGKLLDRASKATFDGTSTTTTNYVYDNAYRLTSATQGGSSWAYTLDNAQARTYSSEPNGYTYWTVNTANQVTSSSSFPSGSATYNYDAAGNTISKSGGRSYVYNYRNQLVQATETSGYQTVTMSFRYDTLGRRVSEERVQGASTTTKHFYYQGSHIVVETDQNGVVQRQNVFGNATDELEFSLDSSGTFRFPMQDALGSVVAVTDSSGAVTTSFTYGPYGETTSTGESFAYGFTGRRYLAEFQLYDLRNRWYDPKMGRFIHQDPVEDPANLGNEYAYVGNNPVNRRDPSGLTGEGDAFGPSQNFTGGGSTFVGPPAPEPPDPTPEEEENETCPVDKPGFKTEPFRRIRVDEDNDPVSLGTGRFGTIVVSDPSRYPWLPNYLLHQNFHTGVWRIANQEDLKDPVEEFQRLLAIEMMLTMGLLALEVGFGAVAASEAAATLAACQAAKAELLAGAAAARGGVSLADDLAAAATRARDTVGPGSGGAYGTRVHSAFEAEVNGLGRGLQTEVSYLNGQVVPRGTPGSVRLDVVNGPLNAPTSIFDLKTGSATLTPGRIQQIQSHVPGGANVPVFEVRP